MRQIPRASRILAPAFALLLAPAAPVTAQGGLAPPGGVPTPPDCPSQCDAILEKLLAPCVQPDGQLDSQCAEEARRNFDHEQCLLDCDQGGGLDVAVLICQSGCLDSYANGLQECTALDGTLDPDCVAAKDIAFVECFTACGEVPWLPDLAACTLPCTEAYRGAVETCGVEGGGIGLSCFEEKRGAYNECLGACGLWLLPLEDVCARRCETAYWTALEACGATAGANGIVDPGDDECVANAQEAFNACLIDCGIKIPDEILCAEDCDRSLQVQLARCEGNAECEKAALDGYTICLEGCGLVVPPIPEPDPCVAGCDLTYQESVRTCYDPATGQVDTECLSQADTAYLACLEGCGVVFPEPPPDVDQGCAFSCETSYRQTLDKCFAVEADGTIVNVDEECVAAADSTYIQCLEGCGMGQAPLPGDPGFPIGECEQGCGTEILGGLFDCAAENGIVDMECMERIATAFNECLAGCTEQAEKRVLGALARTASNRPFIRGDADLSGSIQITDAIRVFSHLFLGEGALTCMDAADANDDGAVNIADGSAILGRLFLGWEPLSAPSGSPGPDPTPDGLGCDER